MERRARPGTGSKCARLRDRHTSYDEVHRRRFDHSQAARCLCRCTHDTSQAFHRQRRTRDETGGWPPPTQAPWSRQRQFALNSLSSNAVRCNPLSGRHNSAKCTANASALRRRHVVGMPSSSERTRYRPVSCALPWLDSTSDAPRPRKTPRALSAAASASTRARAPRSLAAPRAC
jgi:hypothetical protein